MRTWVERARAYPQLTVGVCILLLVVLIFMGLFGIAAGLDRIVNPRLRSAA